VEAFQTYGEAIGDVAPPGSYALPRSEAEVRQQFGLLATPAVSSSPAAAASASSAALACALPVPESDGSLALTLGCGHVDPAFDALKAVDEAEEALAAIESGTLAPSSVDTSYGSAEYRSTTLAFVLPHPLPKASA
jgi:hypothetical protein